MPQYTCPGCNSVLQREMPVPPGKKIRCPKCELVFEPPAAKVTAKAVAKPAPPRPAPRKIDDDLQIDRNPYGVVRDEEEEDKQRAEKERAARGLVRDRFEKSKRGPASRELVRPANFLMAIGVLRCIIAITIFVIALFPLVFSDFYSTAPKEGQRYADAEKQKKQGQSDEEWNATVIQSSIMMGVAVFDFIWGSLVCVGAYKMGNLESLTWAWVGSIMGLWDCLPVGIWCIMVLNNPIVKAGFEEEKPPEV
jgi:hypothetical protein